MSSSTIFIVLVAFCYLAVLAEGKRITLYEHSEIRDGGEDFHADDGTYNCHNLPRKWWYKASAMKTNGHCVALFTRKHCDGPRFRFKENCEYSECCHNANNFGDCKAYNRTDQGEILETVELNDGVKSYIIC
uniref:BPTI/Kunitz inhibitor domain-containing protein n=1 Tax=Panagrellus redivivus TaxID=6233 RepID=A0A7E4UTC8_PANRE